jgi:predicted lipase
MLTLNTIQNQDMKDNEDKKDQEDKKDHKQDMNNEDILKATVVVKRFVGVKSHLAGYIARNPIYDHFNSSSSSKKILVVFRGTLVPRNYWYDAQFTLVDFPLQQHGDEQQHGAHDEHDGEHDEHDGEHDGAQKQQYGEARVHKGFLEAWHDVEREVLDTVGGMIDGNNTEIVLMGHSLGGAVAVLASLAFHSHHYHNTNITIRTYTFGEPRVGNIYLSRYIMSLPISITRITYEKDWVPHSPPHWPFMVVDPLLGFYHHAEEGFITGGITRWCGNVGEYEGCSVGVKWRDVNPLGHLTYWHHLFGPWC